MKYCPLMAFNVDTDMLVLKNFDVPDDTVEQLCKLRKSGKLTALKAQDGGKPTIDIMRGACKESDCAWWSEERKCCGVAK